MIIQATNNGQEHRLILSTVHKYIYNIDIYTKAVEHETHSVLEYPLYDDVREHILLHVNNVGMTLNDQFTALLSNT